MVRGRFSDGRERMSTHLLYLLWDAARGCWRAGGSPTGARHQLHRNQIQHGARPLIEGGMSSVGAGTPLIGLGEASRAVGTGGGAGTSVRVTGRLVEFDAATACALIEHRGEELSIDVSALGGSRMRQGELLQFIGEAFPGRHGAPQPYVRARIVRNVDNLDMQTYEKAVLATRAFIDGLAG